MIDNDHRKLINMANAFFEALANGQGNDVQSKVLNNLIVYTREHFGREEAEMQRINYASSAAHKNEHTKLIQQVGELKAKLDSGGKLNAVTIYNFLSDWLRNHILLVDKKLALTLKK